MELEKSILFKFNDLNCEYRTLHEADVTQEYVNGLRKQTEYIENIPADVSISNQQQYIKEILLSKSNTINGFFISNKLVGTAGIQSSVNFFKYVDVPDESVATIGIFLFDINCRGMGLGKTLVWSSAYLLHDCTGANWFGAGMAKENIPSLKSFLSCGFTKVYDDEGNYRVLLKFSELKKPEIIREVSIHEIDQLIR